MCQDGHRYSMTKIPLSFDGGDKTTPLMIRNVCEMHNKNKEWYLKNGSFLQA